MALEGNYVDSHGQWEIGVREITRLLDLANPTPTPQLKATMTRPIRWDIIEQNYDQLVKYATAIRVGTALLRRFTRNASHPVYQAIANSAARRKRSS